MQPFQWEDIDHSLVSLRTTSLAEEMHSRIQADERRIRFENSGNSNDNALPSLVLEMKQNLADEWVRRVYEVYCQVWQMQGYAKSAAFVRAVCARGLVPVLRARTDAIAEEFSRFATRTNFPSALRDAHLQSHQLKMQRLEDRWRRRLEAEAKECEHAKQRQSRPQTRECNSDQRRDASDLSGNTLTTHVELSAPKPQESELAGEAHRMAVIKKVRNPQGHTILSTPEAALYFEVQPRTIHRWLAQGKLKSGARRGSITIESIRRWEKRRSQMRLTN